MPAPATPMDLLAREARVTPGPVSRVLNGEEVQPGFHLLAGDSLVLVSETGIALRYEKGHGVTADRPEGHDPAEEALWLNGTIYAGIAAIHGYYPIHASAVAVDGKVHAFTGPSGAGKSTIVAALSRLGLPLFSDDTLVLDLSDPERVLCLPGHKRLKLWPEALDLTGARREDEVRGGMNKFFASPASGTCDDILPLAELVFLEEGEPARFDPLRGAQRLMRLEDDHYTRSLFLAASGQGRAERFHMLAAMARATAMTRFVRPRDPARFATSTELALRHVTGTTGE